MEFIKSENMSFSYEFFDEDSNKNEKLEALKNINISIKEGEFVAVLGHNGSGKSTFAKHLNALLIPEKGNIYINGYDSKNEENIWLIRQSCGMVFQNPDNQIIATIVEEDVAFGAENLGIEPKEIRRRVDNALKSVKMSEYATKSSAYLSGGQKQRIAIAGVLAMKPKCIVLDESTAMLDPTGRKEVLDTIIKLNKEENITVILITHYMEEAVLADRVVIMNEGQVVMDGVPKEIFKNVSRMKELSLDVPQVTELSFRLRESGIKMPEDILTIEEMTEEISKIFEGVKINPFPSSTQEEQMENKNVLLELEDLTYIYGEKSAFEKVAVDNVNLKIYESEFISIIGHTGSGKSTLIQHFNGLLKPTRGRVLFRGQDINLDKKNLRPLRQKIGLVFQYPEHQLFEVTVFKDVSFGPEKMGLSPDEVDKRVRESLELVGVPESVYEKSPFELSGGQKRRVAIAGVLAMKPEILILDEPAAGLDPKGREEILSQIKYMHDKLKISIILISHSMEDVSRLAERVIVLANGKVIEEGGVKKIFSKVDTLEKIGLAAPQISYLMRNLHKKGLDFPTDIYTVEDAYQVFSDEYKRCVK